MTGHETIEPTRPDRRIRRAGAAAFVVAAVFYLISEAVTAAAWSSPPYDYARNWVSDLGVPECGTYEGRAICSPLHDLQNAGFITEGVLFAFGSVVLALHFGAGLRRTALTLGLLTGAGQVMVGLTHTSSRAVADGSVLLHYIGAGFGILAPTLLAIVIGVAMLRRGVRTLGTASLVLGVVGTAAALLLVATISAPTPSGIVERTAIYATIVWQLAVGAVLLAAPRLLVDRRTSVAAGAFPDRTGRR